MKSTIRWFYLTGSLTVLVLALMGVLWVMSVAAAPPGATELTGGELATNVSVVSPDLDIVSGDREYGVVEVTLTNTALDTARFVGDGPAGQSSDFDLNKDGDKDSDDAILITIQETDVYEGTSFRVRLRDGVEIEVDYQLEYLPEDLNTILPMVDRNGSGSVTIADIEIADDVEGATHGPSDVSLIEVQDAADGRLLFYTKSDLKAGNVFALRFATSPQETALTNVKGDSGSFDLLTVEAIKGTAGEYSGTFIAVEDIVIDMGTGLGDLDTITHEQHDVPAGLRGNVSLEDQIVEAPGPIAASTQFDVTLKNPPLRSTRGHDSVTAADITIGTAGVSIVTVVDQTTGWIRLMTDANTTLDTGDDIKVTYRGSDSFEIEVDFAPMEGPFTEKIVPSDTDVLAEFEDFFQIISTNTGTGVTKIGVIVGTGDDDDDLNEALASHITVIGVSYTGTELVTVPTAVTANGTFEVTLDFAPQDANGIDAVTAADVVIITGDVGVTRGDVVSVNGRSVTFRADSTLVGGETFTVAYALRVGQNPRNALRPNEQVRPVIQVGAGSRVTITSDDDKATVDAESDAPQFENATPGDGSATDDLAQVLSIDISDALAGVDTDTIRFLVSDDEEVLTADADLQVFGDGNDENITITTLGDIITASVALDDLDDLPGLLIDDDGVTDVFWFVQASDEAGNTATTDADSDDGGNQGFSLRVDNEDPEIEGVFIGDLWNADEDRIDGDRRIGVGQFLGGSGNPKMIRVEFSEDLDGNSITTSDFSVTDADGNPLAIANVQWFDEDNSDERAGAAVARRSVFIELEQALSAGDVPQVNLIGTVNDAAGNTVTNVTIESDDVNDGIAPTATVLLDTTLSTEDVVITVRADESIRTLEPELELFISTSDDSDIAVAVATGIQPPRSKRTSGENEWTFNLSIADSNKYSVVVTVDDASRNQSTTGEKDWTDSGSISFEIDDTLPRPVDAAGKLTTLPLDDELEATFSDPFFIEINWLSEDAEYTGDSQKNVDLTKAVLDEGDSNERDVMGLTSSRDGRRWTIAVPGIGLGEHTLTFNGEDALGNTLSDDEELTFTVVARPSFGLSLTPGMNLVSIPGEPSNNAINTVFGDSPAVDLVFTRDGDLWLVAQRDAESDMFEATGGISDLTSIDAQHAYWVRASASVTVEIDIPALGAQRLLPSIDVMGNTWNLVPVISLLPLEKIPQGSTLDADNYLGTNWTRAFTFERGQWRGVVTNLGVTHICGNPDQTPVTTGDCGAQDPANAGEFFTEDEGAQTDDAVDIGRGYWVWFTEDGTITP